MPGLTEVRCAGGCGYLLGYVKEGEKPTGNPFCGDCETKARVGKGSRSMSLSEQLQRMDPEEIELLKRLLKVGEQPGTLVASAEPTAGQSEQMEVKVNRGTTKGAA